MADLSGENRPPTRRALDEQIASKPKLALPVLPPGATPSPVETHLARHRRRPVAVAIVENGLVRPLDPAVKLPERSRVIVAAAAAEGP